MSFGEIKEADNSEQCPHPKDMEKRHESGRIECTMCGVDYDPNDDHPNYGVVEKLIGQVLKDSANERVRQAEKFGVRSQPCLNPYLLSRIKGCTPERISEELEIPTEVRAKQLCDLAFKRSEGSWSVIALEEFVETISELDDKKRYIELVQLISVCLNWAADLKMKIDEGGEIEGIVGSKWSQEVVKSLMDDLPIHIIDGDYHSASDIVCWDESFVRQLVESGLLQYTEIDENPIPGDHELRRRTWRGFIKRTPEHNNVEDIGMNQKWINQTLGKQTSTI